MPDEYFFRGTIPQYWDIVYAEYQRLYKSLGRKPFEITAPNPATQDLASYVPGNGDTILLAFWNTEHSYEISVDAEFSPDREMVQVMVFYQGPFTKQGESALAVWREVKRELEKDGRLIDVAKSMGKPPKPKNGSQLDLWFDYYHNMHAAQFNYTFKDLSRDSGHTAGHIANMHGNYKKERGLT